MQFIEYHVILDCSLFLFYFKVLKARKSAEISLFSAWSQHTLLCQLVLVSCILTCIFVTFSRLVLIDVGSRDKTPLRFVSNSIEMKGDPSWTVQ